MSTVKGLLEERKAFLKARNIQLMEQIESREAELKYANKELEENHLLLLEIQDTIKMLDKVKKNASKV